MGISPDGRYAIEYEMSDEKVVPLDLSNPHPLQTIDMDRLRTLLVKNLGVLDDCSRSWYRRTFRGLLLRNRRTFRSGIDDYDIGRKGLMFMQHNGAWRMAIADAAGDVLWAGEERKRSCVAGSIQFASMRRESKIPNTTKLKMASTVSGEKLD
jgi:hypothetical protein